MLKSRWSNYYDDLEKYWLKMFFRSQERGDDIYLRRYEHFPEYYRYDLFLITLLSVQWMAKRLSLLLSKDCILYSIGYSYIILFTLLKSKKELLSLPFHPVLTVSSSSRRPTYTSIDCYSFPFLEVFTTSPSLKKKNVSSPLRPVLSFFAYPKKKKQDVPQKSSDPS